MIQRRAWAIFGHAAVGIAAVLCLTFAAFQLHVNLPSTGFLYLLAIVMIAMQLGFGAATFSSFAAAACLNYYFVPPIFTWRVDDPGNWVALFAFEFTALIVSRLSTTAQEHAQVASLQSSDRQKLYQLSRGVLLMDREKPPCGQMLALMRETLGIESAGLFYAEEPKTYSIGPDAREMELAARATYMMDRSLDDTENGVWQRVLRLDGKAVGALTFQSRGLSPDVVDAVSSLTVIAIERSRSFERAAKAEAARHSEQLRTAVLDSLAHAFKTPLTVIRAASTGLLEAGSLRGSDEEMVKLIDQESERLNNLATQLLKTARLDRAEPRPPEDCSLREIIEQVLYDLSWELSARPVAVRIAGDVPKVRGNRELLTMGITQVVDNAAKYSTPGSVITIAADSTGAGAVVTVHNVGSTIREEESERIFERFYRSKGSQHLAAGTGIGLSVTKRAAEAQGGRAWVESDERHGTTFYLSLPNLTDAAPARKGVTI
jgi:two-component system sensor histidine kinase KdpD